MKFLPWLGGLLSLLPSALLAAPTTYTVTGQIAYAATSSFGQWQAKNAAVTGKLAWDAQAGTATGEVFVDLARWDSKNNVRDEHTRTMFDTAKFTRARFVVKGIERKGNEPSGCLVGTMEIHGVTAALKIPGTYKLDQGKLVFDGAIVLRLTDWGIKTPAMLGATVNNEVKVSIHGEGVAP